MNNSMMSNPAGIQNNCPLFRRAVSMLAALALAAGQCAASAHAAPPIAQSFHRFWAAAKSRPFPQQLKLWDQYIERPRESLYRSVVWETRDYPHWKKTKSVTLKYRFADYPRIAARIPAEVKRIKAAVRVEAARFRRIFPGAPAHPDVVMLLAPDFDSKSGVLPGGKPVLVLAVDTLIMEKAELRILLPHEFFHLYDADHAGVKNDGVMPGTSLTLPLFAEGMATFVSSMVTPGYADARYLFQKSLGALPDSRLPAAASAFLADANVSTIDPARHKVSKAYARWFDGGRKQYQPDYPNRAGYWLGLHLIRQLRRSYSLQAMASWPPAKAQAEMRAALLAMAARG